MSRLDQHVAKVRNKLALSRFIVALAWTVLGLAVAITLGIIVERAFHVSPPRPIWFVYGGACAALLGAIVYAFVRRPSAKNAAVAIDEKLGLKEKISTALYLRSSASDPFEVAALKDAEDTAQKVVVESRRHFPLEFPRIGYGTLGALAMALIAFWCVPAMDLFGREAEQKKVALQIEKQKAAETAVKKALAVVEAVPKGVANTEAIRNAKIELQNLLNTKISDPQTANRTALKALQDAQEALKQQVKENSKYAEAQNEMKMMKNLQPAADEKGPVADARRELAKGNFTEATKKMDELVSKFDQLDQKQKEEAAKQMQDMARQLQQMAGDPKKQSDQLAQQLQQMGANQQQAQQMAKQMQQAAQGDKQAQQQLAQQAQQMMQQMNNGQGPTQQQQQQIQQMMQQMQAQANSAAGAQQMAQAAQQMQQAMQQAAQGQQQGQQPNQQAGQLGQAAAQMQQQLQQMEAAAQDAAQVAAAQQQMMDAAQEAQGNCNGGQAGDPGGELKGRKDGAGQWAAGDPNGRFGAGLGGPGIGEGGRAKSGQAPFGVKQETSPTPDNGKGRILASTLVKDNNPQKGVSTISMKEAAEAAQREAADEVDSERVSKAAQNAVKNYFQSMEKDAPSAPQSKDEKK